MANLQDTLLQLYKNLNMLQEREAKYGIDVPVVLRNQIDDHKAAIKLTEQLKAEQLS